MTRWGPGHFEDDGARRFLADVVEHFAHQIDDVLDGDAGDAEPTALGESVLMPAVALLTTLCERHGAMPPAPERVRHWQQAYLPRWLAAADSLVPDAALRAERERLIRLAFARLGAVAATELE